MTSADRLWTCRVRGTSAGDKTDNDYDWHDQLNSFGYEGTDMILDPTDYAGKTPASSHTRAKNRPDIMIQAQATQ